MTPRVDAVVGHGAFDPDKDFVKLAAIYSDLLQLARQLERETQGQPARRYWPVGHMVQRST